MTIQPKRAALALFFFAVSALAASDEIGSIQARVDTHGYKLANEPRIDTSKLTTPATIELQLELDSDGSVSAIRNANGPSDARLAAVQSAPKWRFVKDDKLPATLWVHVYFTAKSYRTASAPPPVPPLPFGHVIDAVKIDEMPVVTQSRIERMLNLRPGVTLTEKNWNDAEVTLSEIDPHLQMMLQMDSPTDDGKLRVRIRLRQ